MSRHQHVANLRVCCAEVCLMCLFCWVFVPLENFSLLWWRHHYRWRAANFDIYLALMVIAEWGFFSVPHLLRHGTSVYDGHLRGPMTLTAVAKRLELSCHYLFNDLSRSVWDSNTQPSTCEANAINNCITAAARCSNAYARSK